MLTFRDLQLEVLRHIDEADDASTTLALVKDGLNRSHRRLLGARTWPFMLWPREESFTTVAGTRVYALKPNVGKLLSLYDYTLNQPCPLISRREWESVGTDRTGTQTVPLGAIYGDVWPVAAQPASATVSLVSTSVSDVTGTVILEGLNSSGDVATETLTLNGTTPVVSSTTWLHLWKVTTTGTRIGTITLSSGATTLLTLTASQYAKQYPTLEFIETPAGARTYLYTGQRVPNTLVNDYDVPDTPYPYSEIHVYDCLLDLSTYNTELGAKEQRMWKERYEALFNGLLQSVDEGIAGSRPRYVRNMNPRTVSRVTSTPA